MKRLWFVGAALIVAIVGCHPTTHHAAAVDPTVLVARAVALHTPAGNRTATTVEARRLLGLAGVPSGAKLTTRVSPTLDAPAMAPSGSPSFVDVHRFWHVSSSLDAVLAYLKAHSPKGLSSGGSTGSSVVNDRIASESLVWSEADQVYATNLELEVTIAPAAHGGGTEIRADGMGLWIDPRPLRDRANGPRMRVSVAGSCPRTDRLIQGIKSSDLDLADRLLPEAVPTGGLVCAYGGMNSSPPFTLLRSARLNVTVAHLVTDAFAALPTGHVNEGPHSCPADDGSVDVIAFSYDSHPDTNLWMSTAGCTFVSNGAITVVGGVDLGKWVPELEGAQ